MRRTGAFVSSVAFAMALGGCIDFWAAYEDPQSFGSNVGEPLPEPSWKELASGMMLQTYYVANAADSARFAMRRCRFVEGLPERCEITIIDGDHVLERVPTFLDGSGDWGEQAKASQRAVVRAMKRWLGRDRVALTRLGVFGRFLPEEGLVSARVEDGQVVLSIMQSDGAGPTVGRAPLPAGLATVAESHYVSERAPRIYVVELEASGARDNGYVAFARVEPGYYRAIASLGPLQ